MLKFICLITPVFFVAFNLPAQETFIKTVDDNESGVNIRVLATPDQGWVLFSLDSLKIYKYNSCGIIEWSKKYHLPGVSHTGDFIKTRDGGFVILSRVLKNSISVSLLTKLDVSGTIQWSKSYEEPSYYHYPYTLNEDNAGNLVLFGNLSHVSTAPNYNMICKINSVGNIIWTTCYNHGGIWGGAIVTTDNGVLARTGNLFIKTGISGHVEWTVSVAASGYNYFAPVEVSDGYIFNNYTNGSGEINFYKMDKLGNQLWNGRKTLDYFGIPPFLRKKTNGNFAGVFNKLFAGKKYTTVIEFDSDLNVIHQSTLNSSATLSLTGSDICFSGNQSSIITGIATDTALIVSPFFAKLDSQYFSGCDTLFALNVTNNSSSQSFISSNEIAFNLISANEAFSQDILTAGQVSHCSNLTPLRLNIGPDAIVCEGTALQLQNHSGDLFETYKWSTGATTSSITVTEPGVYALLATSRCGQDTSSDTLSVSAVEFPSLPSITDTSICSLQPLILDAEIAGATYQWQDGSLKSKLIVSQPGDYFVDVTLSNCVKRYSANISDCEIVTMPNVFTPNDDHKNDFFAPIEIQGVVSATMTIYNRWGDEVYSTTDIKKGWDGSGNKIKSTGGVYYWILNYSNYRLEKKVMKGVVELITD